MSSISKRPVKNVFDICQAKKMIGKQLIQPCAAIIVNKREIAEESKKMRDTIISTAKKRNNNAQTITITGFVSNGILYVINGLDRYFAIALITYNEIKSIKGLEVLDVIIIQYPKLTKIELAALLQRSS
jgi:hypothetical protein